MSKSTLCKTTLCKELLYLFHVPTDILKRKLDFGPIFFHKGHDEGKNRQGNQPLKSKSQCIEHHTLKPRELTLVGFFFYTALCRKLSYFPLLLYLFRLMKIYNISEFLGLVQIMPNSFLSFGKDEFSFLWIITINMCFKSFAI